MDFKIYLTRKNLKLDINNLDIYLTLRATNSLFIGLVPNIQRPDTDLIEEVLSRHSLTLFRRFFCICIFPRIWEKPLLEYSNDLYWKTYVRFSTYSLPRNLITFVNYAALNYNWDLVRCMLLENLNLGPNNITYTAAVLDENYYMLVWLRELEEQRFQRCSWSFYDQFQKKDYKTLLSKHNTKVNSDICFWDENLCEYVHKFDNVKPLTWICNLQTLQQKYLEQEKTIILS